jgi:hypothetical protein
MLSGPHSFRVARLARSIEHSICAPGRRLPHGTLGVSRGLGGDRLGYLGLTPSQAESGLTDNELHKVRHASFPAP